MDTEGLRLSKWTLPSLTHAYYASVSVSHLQVLAGLLLLIERLDAGIRCHKSSLFRERGARGKMIEGPG